MISYWVSLDVKTQSRSLSDLSKELGIEPSPGSFDKGTMRLYGRKKGTPTEHTVLRFESAAPEPAPLTEHFRSIFSRLPVELLKGRTAPSDDWEIWLTIGMNVPVDQIVYPELVIPPECVHMLDGTKTGIAIIVYPYHGEPPQENEGRAATDQEGTTNRQ